MTLCINARRLPLIEPPPRAALMERKFLPYGRWRRKDGSAVLFNRSYKPLLLMRDGQCGIYPYTVGNGPWITGIVESTWLYNDATARRARLVADLAAVLDEWRRGDPDGPVFRRLARGAQ